MARKRDRIFALMGAIVFFVTGSTVTIAVVWQGIQDHKTSTQQADAAKAQANCQDTKTEEADAAPEVFKPAGPVSSLQKTDLQSGSGAMAKDGQCLVMKYYGSLATTGAVFDENFTKTSAFAFVLGSGQVIKGWDQGLAGMKVGGTRRLVIPASLAYGSQAQGSIPANSDLVFVVKLLRIQK